MKLQLLFLVFLTVEVLTQKPTSCVEGQKIVTRQMKNLTYYRVRQRCLCPIDFISWRCLDHRLIKCYLTPRKISPQSIDQANFQQTMNIKMQVNAECYVQVKGSNYLSLQQFILSKRLQQNGLKYELEYQHQGQEIIWSNRTDIFDSNGLVKCMDGYNCTEDENGVERMSEEDEEELMYGDGSNVQYNYAGNFMGIPITNSTFRAYTKAIRPSQNPVMYHRRAVTFQNTQQYEQYINSSAYNNPRDYFNSKDLSDIIDNPDKLKDINQELEKEREKRRKGQGEGVLPYFSIEVEVNISEVAEFQSIRLEVELLQFYRMDLGVVQTGLNAAEFIIPVKVPGVGEAPVYSINFNRQQISRWFYLAFFLVIILIAYLVYKWREGRRRQRNSAIQMNIDEMVESSAWN